MRQGRQVPLSLSVNPHNLPAPDRVIYLSSHRCKSRRRCCIRTRRCLQRLRFTNSLAGHCSSHCEYSSARARHPTRVTTHRTSAHVPAVRVWRPTLDHTGAAAPPRGIRASWLASSASSLFTAGGHEVLHRSDPPPPRAPRTASRAQRPPGGVHEDFIDVFESRRANRGDYYQLQACRVVDVGDTSCESYIVRRHGSLCGGSVVI
jgi:hypothetical protein